MMQSETNNAKIQIGESALRDIAEEELKAILADHVGGWTRKNPRAERRTLRDTT